jgi:hypothetical protein
MKPLPPLALAALAAGCAAPGPYPSLEPREVERVYAEGDPVRPVPGAADRAGIAARIATLLAEGREGDAAFAGAVGAARALVGRAGASASETWVEAQQAISRAEAARGPTARALAELDQFAAAEAAAAPLSEGDYRRLTEGVAELQRIANRQQDELKRLQGALRGG